MDFQVGLNDDDFEFLEKNKNISMAFEVIFSRADRVKPEHWMDRALGLSFQLRKYHEIIHPICHIVSSHGDFGIKGLQASI